MTPPPLELFQKIIRFDTAILTCVVCYYQNYKKCTFCLRNIPKRRLIGISFQESRKCGKFSYKTVWMHTVALSHIRFPFVTVRQEIYNGLKTHIFIYKIYLFIQPSTGRLLSNIFSFGNNKEKSMIFKDWQISFITLPNHSAL